MNRDRFPVFLSVAYPVVNGITIYSLNLARGLAKLGYPTRILLTEVDTTLASYDESALEIPTDVEVTRLPVARSDGWGRHWGALIRLLHNNAPCVYVPNADYRHSIVSPALHPEVLITGIVHADEALHYDHVARLGKYWNQIVCVSREVGDQIHTRFPEFESRTTTILNGVETPPAYPGGRSFAGPLTLVYHGSLRQQQKRVLDFPDLLRRIRANGVEASLTLIGSGPDEDALRDVGADLIANGSLVIEPPLPNEVVRQRLRDFHVYVLNSEFEGMPQALLEAMSQGCVPLVTSSSGTREVVRDGHSGYLVELGDFDAFADRAARLSADRGQLERMSRHAYYALPELGLRLEDMARSYDALFARLFDECMTEGFRASAKTIEASPAVVDGLSVFPVELRAYEPKLGRFPSWSDADDFAWEVSGEYEQSDPRRHSVLLAVRDLDFDHGTELAVELCAALRGKGFDARLVIQRPAAREPLAISDLPRETVRGGWGWRTVAGRTKSLVQSYGPCTYVSFDRETAKVAARLPSSVRKVVLVNGHDVPWLRASNLVERVDALVFTAPGVEFDVFPEPPPEGVRVTMIPYPVHTPAAPGTQVDNRVLTVLTYLGHLDGVVSDLDLLRKVLIAAGDQGVSLRFVVAGLTDSQAVALGALGDVGAGIFVEAARVGSRGDLCSHLEAAQMLLASAGETPRLCRGGTQSLTIPGVE